MNPTIERRAAAVPKLYRKQYLSVVDGPRPPGRKLALKIMCMECMGYERKEIAQCLSTACPLHRLRPFQRAQVPPKQAE